MAIRFFLGALTSWVAFTKEGHEFGNKAYAQAMAFIKKTKEKEYENEKNLRNVGTSLSQTEGKGLGDS